MTTASIASTNYSVLLQNGRHEFRADEPVASGGADSGPTPDELLESALASCTAITLKMYAERKQWPVAGITVTVSMQREGDNSSFERKIAINGNITDEQRQRLLQIAKACPVSKTLTGNISVNTLIS
jgi:putative redox protein